MIEVCSIKNKAFQLDIYFREATLTSNCRVYNCKGNTIKCMQNTCIQYLVVGVIGDVY